MLPDATNTNPLEQSQQPPQSPLPPFQTDADVQAAMNHQRYLRGDREYHAEVLSRLAAFMNSQHVAEPANRRISVDPETGAFYSPEDRAAEAFGSGYQSELAAASANPGNLPPLTQAEWLAAVNSIEYHTDPVYRNWIELRLAVNSNIHLG
jgi:hypothetical protein